MRSYYERVIYTFHHFLIQIQTDFRSQTCQRRYNHFYNSYFITSFLYSQRNIHGRQMDYYRSFLGLRFKRSVPLCRKTSIGNYPGAMPFYFLLCYPFYCIREIGFITVISIALLAFHFKRKSVQSYSLFFILSISSLCIYWEIFSRSTILINAVLFTLFLLYLERFRTFSTRQLIWSAVIGGLLFSIRNVFVLPLIVWGLYQLFQEKTSPKKIFLWGFVFLLSFAITFVPFIWLYPDEFWEVNPFSTQSSLVSFHFIVLFVLIAIAGSFFCRNYNDVRFFSVLLLFGIVTIHFIEAVCQYSFTQALFQSKADISYYIFCIPYLLQILADTDYKRLMNPQT